MALVRFTLAAVLGLGVWLASGAWNAPAGRAQSNPIATAGLLRPGPQQVRAIVTDESGKVIPDIKLSFTTIDVPGAGYTGVLGINKAGEMVGDYGQNTNDGANGFSYSGGTFTYFNYPGQSVTVPSKINDSGLIVGSAGSAPVVGFFYDGTSFTTIRDGSDSATVANGINNAGVTVGGAGTIYTTKGFELRGQTFKDVSPPGTYVYIYATSINSSGEVVGWTDSAGFAYNHGKFTNIAFPGATQTEAWGINDAGVIVGWYAASGCTCAFASKNGKYVSFRYPGAAGTLAYGINASGQMVGGYTFDFNAYHGFVTSPLTDKDFR